MKSDCSSMLSQLKSENAAGFKDVSSCAYRMKCEIPKKLAKYLSSNHWFDSRITVKVA